MCAGSIDSLYTSTDPPAQSQKITGWQRPYDSIKQVSMICYKPGAQGVSPTIDAVKTFGVCMLGKLGTCYGMCTYLSPFLLPTVYEIIYNERAENSEGELANIVRSVPASLGLHSERFRMCLHTWGLLDDERS